MNQERFNEFKEQFIHTYFHLRERQGNYVFIEDIESEVGGKHFWEDLWRFARFDDEGRGKILLVPSRELEERKTYSAGGRRYSKVSITDNLLEKYS